MPDTQMNDAGRKARIRRSALIVSAVALAFYISFILIGVGNA